MSLRGELQFDEAIQFLTMTCRFLDCFADARND